MKRFSSSWLVILFVVTTVFGAALPGTSANAAAPASGQAAVSAAELPTSSRRAAQHLEDLRSSEMAPNWSRATLGKSTGLFRPDLRSAAYIEYQVNVGGKPAGFIIVSAGQHDFPLAHWNDRGASPTAMLRSDAAALDKKIARFYKLDSLTYAAEDAEGNLISLYPPKSPLPTSVKGQDPAMLDQKSSLSHETWTPSTRSEDGKPEHRLSQSGPKPTGKIELGGWESWRALKAGFAQTYQTMMLSLAKEAKHDWDIDKAAAKLGEGLVAGHECEQVASLENDPKIELRGEGARFADGSVRKREGLLPVIELCVMDSPPQEGLRLDLVITYPSGKSEILPYAVLSAAFDDSAPQGSASATSEFDAPEGAWGPWTYYWAGYTGDQRRYSQISAGTYNNPTSCYSGCGATAWAMLFGWADNKAATGSSYWAPRWGLYRANGGYGADAVAPSTMSTGVRNMTMEIRYDIGTFCAFGSGATPPWDMDGAGNYLSGRSGTRLSTHYNVLGIHEGRLREYARDSIRDRGTPAIIGTGWLTHYPLAWGYAWQSRTVNVLWWTETEYNRWFYVNQGWGGSGDGWVSASTWFAGEIYP